MGATETEIQIDLDAADGKEVAERSQVAPDDTRTTPDDIKIEVTEATQPEKAPKKDASAPLTSDEGIEKLKKQLADEKQRAEEERQGRLAAEQRAHAASEDAARAKTESQGTQLDLVKNAIASLTQASDALEEKYAAALASQDFSAAAKVQREMSANEAKLVELNRGKNAMERAPKVAPTVSSDPVEAFAQRVAANGFPKSAAWVRSHPEYARDPAKNRKMLAAHEMAMADGFAADSPEYFASVEDTLKISQPRQETPVDDPSADAARPSTSRPSRQTAPPSAPVSRSGNGTGGSDQNRVRLSPEMREMARMMFPDSKTPEEDYARNMIALEREGKLTRSH